MLKYINQSIDVHLVGECYQLVELIHLVPPLLVAIILKYSGFHLSLLKRKAASIFLTTFFYYVSSLIYVITTSFNFFHV